MRRSSCPAAISLALFCAVLTGCAFTSTSVPSPTAGSALKGKVFGGQQPIAGAQVYLFAAGTGGYGGPGIAASASNASVSLLKAAANTTIDASNNYYVTTDSLGNFSVGGDYTCTANSQVYLYAVGGNPGSGANTGAGLLAALGNCPAAGNFAAATPFVFMNEVSTIAAAYSFAGFATDATHVSSSGTALATVGISNAFLTPTNLADLASGVALTTTPGGNGSVPQATINTLANILAACVNSTTGSAACTALFANAESGGTTGTIPTDTATAAINIAHNPAAAVAALYALAFATPPFSPALVTPPNDFTLGVSFTNSLNGPNDVAIDGQGNVWIVNAGSTISKLSTLGVPATGSPFGGLAGPSTVTIDLLGNAWINNATGTVAELNSAGTQYPASPYSLGTSVSSVAIDTGGNAWVAEGAGIGELSSSGVQVSGSPWTGGNVDGPVGIGIDGSGSVWVSSDSNSTVEKLSSSGTYLSGSLGYSGGGLNFPGYLAIDHTGKVWVANQSASVVTVLSNSGSFATSTGYSDGGYSQIFGVGIDGASNVWLSTYGNVLVEMSSTGQILSGLTGYQNANFNRPDSLAIDGSGNVWTANVFGNNAVELVGASTPVITPITAGLPTTPTVDGSSNLGTRP